MWNTVNDLAALQERMNRLFEQRAPRRHADHSAEADDREIERTDWQPAADVYEQTEEFLIALDVPGVRRESLSIDTDDKRLIIRGERALEGENRRRAERPVGRFVRTFNLPSGVDREKITADYRDGVLRLRLPKRHEQKAQRLEIKIN